MVRLYISPEKDWSSVSRQSVSLPLAVAAILLCSPIQRFKRELWQAAVTFFNFQATAVFWQERLVREREKKKGFLFLFCCCRSKNHKAYWIKNVPKTVLKPYFLTPRTTFLHHRVELHAVFKQNPIAFLNKLELHTFKSPGNRRVGVHTT